MERTKKEIDMDYEEKYKEALSWMREMYPCLTDSLREDAEHFFPELAESEDERMINELQGFLCSYGSDYFGNGEWQKLDDWLEKQKEQKPAEWSDEDEKTRRNLMSLLANMRGDRITEETYQKYYPWLKSLRPPKDCSSCAKHLEGYISGRSDAENKLLEQFGALVTPEDELRIKPRWKPSEEQMEALKKVTGNAVDADEYYPALATLYYDLKEQF